jgi:hypothetical protein
MPNAKSCLNPDSPLSIARGAVTTTQRLPSSERRVPRFWLAALPARLGAFS